MTDGRSERLQEPSMECREELLKGGVQYDRWEELLKGEVSID